MTRLGGWRADQLMCLDESAACERTVMSSSNNKMSCYSFFCLGDRRYEWAPLGTTPSVIQDLKRSTWRILPAFTIEGYIAYKDISFSFLRAHLPELPSLFITLDTAFILQGPPPRKNCLSSPLPRKMSDHLKHINRYAQQFAAGPPPSF